jgi:hypothetical protein
MNVLLDEDTPIQLLEILRRVLIGHNIEHIFTVGWSGKKDIVVLREAAQRGFDGIVTNDSGQLDDPDEVAAIRKSRMHHVRYSQRHGGPDGLALAIGAVVAAMPGVIKTLSETEGQRLVRIHGLDPSRRFDIVDPKVRPPAYWR